MRISISRSVISWDWSVEIKVAICFKLSESLNSAQSLGAVALHVTFKVTFLIVCLRFLICDHLYF